MEVRDALSLRCPLFRGIFFYISSPGSPVWFCLMLLSAGAVLCYYLLRPKYHFSAGFSVTSSLQCPCPLTQWLRGPVPEILAQNTGNLEDYYE